MPRKNTELIVSLVQRGHEEYMPVLWEAVERLVKWYARKFYIPKTELCSQRGVELEDLTQCGYFALLRCLKAYDPEKGAFSSPFVHYLRSEFETALGRSPRLRGDMLNHCISLDAELEEDSDSLYALVPDGYDYAGAVDDRIFRQQLHDALEKALSTIPENEAEVIRAAYYEERTLTEPADRQLREKGLRDLRRSKQLSELERFIDLETNFYKRVSVNSFNATHTSAVEALTIERERKLKEVLNGSYYQAE